MAIPQPKIEFSDWVLWDPNKLPKTLIQCPSLADELQCPGIYVWACSKLPPSAMSLDKPCQEIVYVGEAKKQLTKRVQQFARSCFAGSRSHAGGVQCGQMLKKSKLNLYLSVYPIVAKNEHGTRVPRNEFEKPNHWLRPFLHYVERTVICNYTRHLGHRPECNRT